MKNLPSSSFGLLFFGALAAAITLLSTSAAHAQIFVAQGNGTIGEYNLDGSTINSDLISGGANEIAISGSDLFLAEASNSYGPGTIAEYSLSGSTATLVTSDLITVTGSFNNANGIVASGSDLYVLSQDGTIGKYTLGATPGTIASSNPTLISAPGSPGAGYDSNSLAISGSDLFVSNNNGYISKFNTSGGTVSASLVTGLNTPGEIAFSGSNLFVADSTGTSVEESTTAGGSGTTVVSTLTPGQNANGIAVLGSGDLLVSNQGGTIDEYSSTGTLLTANFIPGLPGSPASPDYPYSPYAMYSLLVVPAVPEPSTWAMMFAGLLALVGVQRFARRV